MQKRVLLAVIALSTACVPAEAQLVNGKWQAPAKSGGSTGTATRKGVEVRPESPAAKPSSNTVVPLRVIHAVLMSDGGVYADFGAGLELVRQACPSGASTMPLQIVGAFPDTVNRPVLSQFTQQQRAASKEAAKGSCHLRDSRGKVFAVR